MTELFGLHTYLPDTELPTTDLPHYIIAKEGLFLRKKTQIGTVLLRESTIPTQIVLGELNVKEGSFSWEGPRIPSTIISQALDFFRRIYTKHQTEAEVLLTKHNDTGLIRIFVPHQRVSGAGVKSVYEPTHIDTHYTVIGTIHSHCMMSAFHSGTDSADASDMDGVHLTLGKVMDTIPEIVAMVVMNKREFHYKDPSEVAELVYDADTAPDWWDNYVYPASTESIKPKSLTSITQAQWDKFRGLATPTVITRIPSQNNQVPATYGGYTPRPIMPYDDDWELVEYLHKMNATTVIPGLSKESIDFNNRHNKKPVSWNGELQSLEQLAIDTAIECAINNNLLDAADWAGINPDEADDPETWIHFFLKRLSALCETLALLGVTVDYEAKDSP